MPQTRSIMMHNNRFNSIIGSTDEGSTRKAYFKFGFCKPDENLKVPKDTKDKQYTYYLPTSLLEFTRLDLDTGTYEGKATFYLPFDPYDSDDPNQENAFFYKFLDDCYGYGATIVYYETEYKQDSKTKEWQHKKIPNSEHHLFAVVDTTKVELERETSTFQAGTDKNILNHKVTVSLIDPLHFWLSQDQSITITDTMTCEEAIRKAVEPWESQCKLEISKNAFADPQPGTPKKSDLIVFNGQANNSYDQLLHMIRDANCYLAIIYNDDAAANKQTYYKILPLEEDADTSQRNTEGNDSDILPSNQTISVTQIKNSYNRTNWELYNLNLPLSSVEEKIGESIEVIPLKSPFSKKVTPRKTHITYYTDENKIDEYHKYMNSQHAVDQAQHSLLRVDIKPFSYVSSKPHQHYYLDKPYCCLQPECNAPGAPENICVHTKSLTLQLQNNNINACEASEKYIIAKKNYIIAKKNTKDGSEKQNTKDGSKKPVFSLKEKDIEFDPESPNEHIIFDGDVEKSTEGSLDTMITRCCAYQPEKLTESPVILSGRIVSNGENDTGYQLFDVNDEPLKDIPPNLNAIELNNIQPSFFYHVEIKLPIFVPDDPKKSETSGAQSEKEITEKRVIAASYPISHPNTVYLLPIGTIVKVEIKSEGLTARASIREVLAHQCDNTFSQGEQYQKIAFGSKSNGSRVEHILEEHDGEGKACLTITSTTDEKCKTVSLDPDRIVIRYTNEDTE